MNSIQKGFSWCYRIGLPLTLSLQVALLISTSNLRVAYAVEPAPQIEQRYQPSDFLTLTNQVRQQNNVAPLTLNDQLNRAALDKAEDMKSQGYFDHFRPSDQKSPWDFIVGEGYTYHYAGENLARGFATPQGITKAWTESPKHMENLVSSHFTEVGFANITTVDGNNQTILLTVQMFGAPQ